MGNFDVFQRTKDGMFNATALLKQWNAHSGQQKEIAHFFGNSATKEFIEAIKAELGIPMTADNEVFVKTRGGKDRGGTWLHPLLFIDFAMWLNPTFKVKVLKFVHDELIKYRKDAGSAYIQMSSSIAKIVDKSLLSKAIPEIAKAINWIVFNRHESQIRNTASETQMQELYELETDISKSINFGFIKSFLELKKHLGKRWKAKWQSKILSA